MNSDVRCSIRTSFSRNLSLMLTAIVLLSSAVLAQPGTVLDFAKISDFHGDFTGQLDQSDSFGAAITAIGDLDSDGVIDLAVGAKNDDDGGENRGAIWILFLNSDGTVKSHQKISNTEGNFQGSLSDNDSFGEAITSLGDLDGDGITDIAVGNRCHDDGGTDVGVVWILFLNADGTVKSHTKISKTTTDSLSALVWHSWFGHSVAAIGDLDGDEVMDIVVGAAGNDIDDFSGGAAWILFLNTDGTVKSSQCISRTRGNLNADLDTEGRFGYSVSRIGDLNDDGVMDIAVGAKYDDEGGENKGAVFILFLNSDGTVKSHHKIVSGPGAFNGELSKATHFGHSLGYIGDLDGDGVEDLAAGNNIDNEGIRLSGSVIILFLNPDGTVKSHQKINSVHGNFDGELHYKD